MITFILLLAHIVVSLVLILVVLLQTGKRADLAGAFGGGGSQTAFGARGAATFLSKATTWSAITFMATSILLGIYFGRDTGGSVVQDSGPVPTSSAPAPAVPAEPVPQAPAGGAPPAAPVNPSPTPGAPQTPPAEPAPAPPGTTK